MDKDQFMEVVNDVMARMFFLLPDVDDHGLQIQRGSCQKNGAPILLSVSEKHTLQFMYQYELMELMTAQLAALPVDEVPLDWIRQIPMEAAEACWALYLTRFDPESRLSFTAPYIPEESPDVSDPQWQLTYQAETYRLRINYL